jgi:hypothetical protein
MVVRIVVDSPVLIKWFYDAFVRALAMELDRPLITADRRLFECARTYQRVRHLTRIGTLS